MSILLELTWRGALMTLVVASLDRLFAARINARVRRIWWLLVPVAFLLTVPLPVLPAQKSAVASPVRSHGIIALSVQAATHSPGPVAVGTLTQLPTASCPVIIVLAGSVLYLLVVLARTCSALHRWRHLPLCTDPPLLRMLQECKARAGITSPVGVVVSERVAAPLILGWLRPRILLPGTLVNSLSREQLRGILFHELAHVRSLDVPCTVLFTLVCALHWFNPAAHFALRAWAQFREEAADEAAVTWLGTSSSLAYGETLLHVLRSTNGPRQTSLAVLAVVESVGQLRKRLLMIKQHASKSSHYPLASAVFLVVAAGVLLHPVRAALPADATMAAPSSGQADATPATPPTRVKTTGVKSLAIQVAGTTVAILPELPSGNMEINGTNLTYILPIRNSSKSEVEGKGTGVVHDDSVKNLRVFTGNVTVTDRPGVAPDGPGTMIYKGEVKVHVTVPGQPPITITGNDLVFVPQESGSPDAVSIDGNSGLGTSKGKLDAAVNLTLPPRSWALRFGGITVAVVPTGMPKDCSMNIEATTGSTFATAMRVATFSGEVTVTLTLPGQAPVTMSGGDLTMVPNW